jgi:hypothetical protein
LLYTHLVDTTSNYLNQQAGGDGSTAFARRNNTGTTYMFLGDMATNESTFVFDCFQPFLAKTTGFSVSNVCNNSGGSIVLETTSGVQTDNTSFTGFSILVGNDSTGTLSVYGYAKA